MKKNNNEKTKTNNKPLNRDIFREPYNQKKKKKLTYLNYVKD